MFDSDNDLAALVYDPEQDPDTVLRRFALRLSFQGYRPVGLVQLGHHAHDDPHLEAVIIPSNERVELFQRDQSFGRSRIDMQTFARVGARIASEFDIGADVLIVNRFGRQEQQGRGLSALIDRAGSADVPVVVAVPTHRFLDWIRFADGMSVKLSCDDRSLQIWWNTISRRNRKP